MPIRVKKPFEPDTPQPKPSLQHIVAQVAEITEINPEFEEKPVVDSTSRSSEDFHGGNELSFSMPDTSVSSPIPMPSESSNSSSNSSSSEQPESTSSSPTSSEASEQQQQQLQPDSSSQQSPSLTSSMQQPSEENPESSSPSSQTSTSTTESSSQQQSITSSSSESQQQQSSQMSEASEQTSESSASTATEQQSSQMFEASSSSEAPATASIATEVSEPQSTNNSEATESAHEPQANEQTDEDEEEENEEDNEEEEEDEDQAYSYTFNTQQAFDVTDTDYVDATTKYYQTEFYRFIEMIAEEKTKVFDPIGTEEYNVKKLMFRPYERRPLNYYKMSRVRDTVVIILDNSGSMAWWSRNIQLLAKLAMQRNDVEVYLAPNGIIEEMLHPKRVRVLHDDVVKKLRNRKIIYVGDFDGGDTPIELSWFNDVIWICPESRYKYFREHSWVNYSEDKFKGAFLRVFELEQLFNALKKLLSSPSLKLWYDLFDEYVESEDEDEDMS